MNDRSVSDYLQRLPKQTRAVLLTCAYGLGAGIVTVAFQTSITLMYRATFVAWSHRSMLTFVAGSFGMIVGAGLIVGFLLSFYCPEAAGSGIPQLKLAFWKEFGHVPWRATWVKFVAGIISLGGGFSLGREGPSVHFAGGVASNLAGVFGEPKQNRRMAAVAGAAAGLAAAFNTPLAAITFVLEEIVEDLNSRSLGSVLLAAVIGAFVVHGLVGQQPAFTLKDIQAPTWQSYCLIPLVAACASFIGLLFHKWTLALRARQKRFERIPGWLVPTLGGGLTWILGVTVFWRTGHLGVFSLGYDDLSVALNQDFSWRIAGILVAAKLGATVACYGFGGCGGIFSPTLFLGGMCGVFMSGLFGSVADLSGADHVVLAVVGMSACLGAAVRAPMTSILIVFEMTHQFSLVPALMLGTLVSQSISRRVFPQNFYAALLVQDGHHLEHVIPPRDLQSWHQLPVSAIAQFQPVIVDDLAAGALRAMLKSCPYQRFPVVQSGTLAGVLSRAEAEAALAENRAPKLQPAVSCVPAQSVRKLQELLIESPTLMVVLVDQPNGRVLGLVTLHDLLRAETAITEQAGDA